MNRTPKHHGDGAVFIMDDLRSFTVELFKTEDENGLEFANGFEIKINLCDGTLELRAMTQDLAKALYAHWGIEVPKFITEHTPTP